MGETLTTWSPSCNGSVRVELSGQRTTSDSGALLLREALDNSGVIEALEDNLVDFRNPLRIRHSLASQLRTLVLQRAMGWIDLSDTETLRRDPLWQLACRATARAFTKNCMIHIRTVRRNQGRGKRGIVSKQRRLRGFSNRLNRMIRIRTWQG